MQTPNVPISSDKYAPLLASDEPHPFVLENEGGASPIVFVCEHGGRRIPAALGTLGLADGHLARHFMWDIGALDLARSLADTFDAPLVHQIYSRMVCDCNRHPAVPSFIPEDGEGVPVPGNVGLDDRDKDRRRAAIWQPFHDALAGVLDRRARHGRDPVLVTIHSFTPVFYGVRRPWSAGVMHDRDTRLPRALLGALRGSLGDRVGENEPYVMDRESDYTVPVHGEDRGIPCVELEVRNDLIADERGVAEWTEILSSGLRRALTTLDLTRDTGTRQR